MSARGANWFALILILWFIPASFLASAIDGIFDFSLGAANSVFQLIMFGIPCAIVLIVYRHRIRDILPMQALDAKNFGMIVGMALLIQPFLMFLSTISMQFSTLDITEFIHTINMEVNFFWALLFLAVTPSILEELAFRGIIWHGYREIPVFKAAAANGLLFGMMHLGINQFMYATVLGFIVCFFVHYTKNILSAVIAHFVVNGTQTAFGLWQMGILEEAAATGEYVTEPSMTVAILTIGILGGLGLYCFYEVFKSFKAHNELRNLWIAEDAAKAAALFPDLNKKDENEENENNEAPIPADTEASREPKFLTAPFWIIVALFIIWVIYFDILPNFRA